MLEPNLFCSFHACFRLESKVLLSICDETRREEEAKQKEEASPPSAGLDTQDKKSPIPEEASNTIPDDLVPLAPPPAIPDEEGLAPEKPPAVPDEKDLAPEEPPAPVPDEEGLAPEEPLAPPPPPPPVVQEDVEGLAERRGDHPSSFDPRGKSMASGRNITGWI